MVKHAVACSLVLLMLVCALNLATGASINRRLARANSVDKAGDWPVGRQAPEDEGSSEDSDEDDEGTDDDAVLQQGQNSYAVAQAAESIEDSDEDGGAGGDDADDDDDSFIRRRRDADAPVEKPKPLGSINEKEDLVEQQTSDSDTAVDKTPETTLAPTTTVAPTRKSSVLVQIRDALKKVTTLPTEQVANNALQYFQLFEHFIQQTIEQYIGDDDDEEEEAAVASVPAATGAAPEGLEAPVAEVASSVEKEDGNKAPEASSEIASKPDSVGEKPATETAAPSVTPADAANNAIQAID